MNLTTADKVLKVFYLPPLQHLLNNQTILWNRLERNENFNVEGKSFTVPLHVSRHTQAGAGRAEEGTLPSKDAQGYNQAIVPAKYIYTRIQVSGQVMRATRSDAGAFIRALRSEIEGATRDTKRSSNRQAHGDGTDALAYYVSGSGGTAPVADDNLGNPFVHVGSKATTVDLIDTGDNSTKHDDSVTILDTGTEVATGTTLTASANVSGSAADGDYWVLEDTLGNQMTGLDGIVRTGDPPLLGSGLHGITASGKAYWQSQIVGDDTAFADLRFANMQRVISKMAQASDYDKDDIEFGLASYFMVDKYYELAANERRAINVMQLDGGYEGVEFSGIPLVADQQCKHNRIYFINPQALRICRMADFNWMDMDGAVLSRVADKDAYEATLYHYGDLACTARNALGALVGQNE